MTTRITEEQKNRAIEAYAEYGTLQDAAREAACGVRTLSKEMHRSKPFREAMVAARKIGHEQMADKAIANIKGCAFGEVDLDKTRLVANLALANAYGEGFRQRVEHTGKDGGPIKFQSNVPRPNYKKEKP